jgi:acetyl esterase/lipase
MRKLHGGRRFATVEDTLMPNRRTLLTSAALAPVLASPFAATSRVAAQEVTPTALQDEVETELDVVYGEVDGQELLLDIRRPPAREQPRPAVILIFGGAWRSGDRHGMADPARRLAEAGYIAFSIDHRLVNDGAENRWPVQLDDVQRAVRWVRAHSADYGVDPERIASYGWSSGAHLATMLGVRDTRDNSDSALAEYSSRVNGVVSLSADLDLTVPQTDFGFKMTVESLFGGTLEEEPEAYRDASPLHWVDAEAAPMLLVHGGLDDTGLAEQSRQMVAALYDAKVDVVYAAIPDVGHDGVMNWSRFGPITLGFLDMQLHPES